MTALFRASALTLAMLTLATPSFAFASWGTTYFKTYDRARQEAQYQSELSDEMMEYVLYVLSTRLIDPVDLTEEEVRSILRGEFFSTCQNQPKKYTLTQCTQLVEDVRYLIESERETQGFADDLLAIANSSELVASDEAHRPNSFGQQTAAFSVIWSGTGASALPWPEDDDVQNAWNGLISALSSEGEDIDKVVLRFRHGLFRISREEQAGWNELDQYGDQTRQALFALADALEINEANTGKEKLSEYATPSLDGIDNLAVWAREDDIGLNWIYPTHEPRFSLNLPDAYPTHYPNGETLSYPFRYYGSSLPDLPGELEETLKSPLCSRISGRHGYLCRSVQDAPKNCPDVPSGSFAIHLITCDETEKIIDPGIAVCSGANLLSQFDLTIHGRSVPSTEGKDLKVCTPGSVTTFDSSFVTNSCFIGFCMKQSLNEHSLVGGRNPIAIMESTTPYLSCMRPDPQLGMLGELPPVAATVLPQYIGHMAVQLYDREQCERTGSPPSAPGICRYRSNRALTLPFLDFVTSADNEEQQALTNQAQAFLKDASTAIGQQYAINQSVPVYEKLIKSLAQGVNAISDLVLELKQAPITTAACPWSGTLCNTQCNDGFDNDGDGRADLEDPDCLSIQTAFE